MLRIEKLILISLVSVFAFSGARSQVLPGDLALQASQVNTGGSARILGIGGVNTSLGGDISSVSTNPAGLGFYNRSEVSLTPMINIRYNNANYLGSANSTTKTRFNMGNLGVVINNSRSDAIPGSWRGGNFGFSYNRINDFNNEIYYAGTNVDNDYLDFVLDFANSNEAAVGDFYLVDQPFYTFLINDYSVVQPGDTIFNLWDSFVEFATPETPVGQSEKIITSGFMNKWDLSYGGNFNDRVYFGLGLGIVSLKYENEKLYLEDRYQESILDYYTLYERQKIDGVGVNGNFGIIVRPLNQLTVGLNLVTPTVISVTDEFETSMTSVWNESAEDVLGGEDDFTGNHTDESILSPLIYSITTPLRLSTGVTYFFNKNGFLSADLEWVDYSTARIHSNEVDFSVDNQEIDELYRSVLNYRVGGEYRIDIFRVRAGFSYQASPLEGSGTGNRSRYGFSGGVGIRKKSFYTDLAMVYTTWEGSRAPYVIDPALEIGNTPVAEFDHNRYQAVVSVGFIF